MDVLHSADARDLYSSSSVKRFIFLLLLKTTVGDLKVIYNLNVSSTFSLKFLLCES